MATILNKENFDTTLRSSDKPVLVDFFAKWCGPCKVLGPTIDELSKEYEGKAIVGKLNIDENPEIASRFGIRSIPTLLYFKSGEIVDKLAGLAPKKIIEEKLVSRI